MLLVTVYGTAAPQGSKRHVGNGVMIESSKRVKPWREAVKFALLGEEAHLEPLDGPVMVTVKFLFQRPKSAPKKKPTWPITRSTGDIDKLLRSTFDAIVDAGAIHDDSQIVRVDATKGYDDVAKAIITISRAPGTHP